MTQRFPPSSPASNPPPVASVSPSPFAPPSRSISHHQTAKQHPGREIVPPRDTARISTNSLLVDNPTTREYVIEHASDNDADPTRQSNPGSDSEMRGHDDRDQGPSQVCPSVHSVCMHIHLRPCEQSQLLPARASRRSSSSLSRVPSRRMSMTPLFLPFPSPSTANSPSEPHSPQLGRANRNSDPLDIISIIPSPNSPASPSQRRPRRSPRKTKNRGEHVRELMVYILVLPLPRSAHKSGYVPVKQLLRTCERQTTASKGKACAGALQGAFENIWDSTVAPSWGPKREKKRRRSQQKRRWSCWMMGTMKGTRGRSSRNL